MIEYNLVRTQSIFSPVYTLIARKRIVAESPSEILNGAIAFLQENHDTLVAALSDQDLVEKIMVAQDVTIDAFMSLKFILAQSGIDVLMHTVAELEKDADGIDENMNEYILIDNLSDGIAKTATKVVLPNDSSNMSEVYTQLCDLYDFFNSPLTSGYKSPIMVQLDQLRRIENAVGISNTSITSYLNSVMEYLGKTIILISNE